MDGNGRDLSEKRLNEIQEEISRTVRLLGTPETIQDLAKDYDEDNVYLGKICDLATKYHSMRKVRPDGNCFFRAFGFAYLEHLLGHKEEYPVFIKTLGRSRELLNTPDFADLFIDDIYQGFFSVASLTQKGPRALNELYSAFNDQSSSDYVVSYLRLVTSAQIRLQEHFYKSFLEGGKSVIEFCQESVEPMNKESDHIHITALSSCLRTPIRVRYMDRSSGPEVNSHDFPEGCPFPAVHLLYRPGHYDILYARSDLQNRS